MFGVSVGLVLRAVGGAVVIMVPVSPWLYLCTVLVSLFLALGKRRNELELLEAGAAGRLPPRTPSGGRRRTIVGADPRLHARETNPPSRNESTVPIRPAIKACQNDTPNPRMNEP